MLHALKGYRTVIVNTIIAVIGLLAAFGVIPDPGDITSDTETVMGAIMVLISAANFVLRIFTDTKVGTKEQTPKG